MYGYSIIFLILNQINVKSLKEMGLEGLTPRCF
jgi:hypothetical protein